MRVGVSTAAFFLRHDNEEAFPALRRLGVDLTEFFLTSFSEYSQEFTSPLLAQKGNVDVHSVHILTNQVEPQLFSVHPKVRADSFRLLGGVMEAARSLGAKYYTFHGIARARSSLRSGEHDPFDKWGEVTREIFDFCASYGVTLCQENVEWAVYNRPGVFTRLKERCPELKGVLDVKQARLSGHDWRSYLAEMGPALAHVHVSDVDSFGKMCLPGKGVFPFRELIDRLKDVGFDGPLLIEPYERDYEREEELVESLAFLRSLL
ncbi:MAG: sugar phosphate isomerase/epimerase family protein [Christensenellaceae bacterium]